jgi:hypothetical protein
VPGVLGADRDALGGFGAVELRDHRQRHVGAGGDTGRRREGPVLHPARLRHPVDLVALTARELEEHLVRGRAAAVEQPRLRQQRRAGAHRHRHLGRGRALAQEVEQRRVGELRDRAHAARQQDQVELRAIGEVVAGHRLDAGVRRHRAFLLRHRHDLQLFLLRAELVDRAEHLERAVEIQQLEVRIEHRAERANLRLRHDVLLRARTRRIVRARGVVEDEEPSFPASRI